MFSFRNSTGVGSFATGVGSATMSALSTMVMFNIIGMVNQLPGVLGRLCGHVKLWWFREVQITIPEQGREWYVHNRVFSAVETYLGTMSSDRALRLKAGTDRAGRNVMLTMDDAEEITDVFLPVSGDEDKRKARTREKAINVKWSYYCRQMEKGGTARLWNNEKKYYMLTFDARHRPEVVKQYLVHVMETSRDIEMRNRQRKIFTNSMGGAGDQLWTKVVFKHPASFATLAMDPQKKQEIMDDLETFSKSQDYYAKIGKTWKRGYLLYGPPGTGKSTMIACMANFLDYDVYDLELTAVRDNTELRRLIVNTTGKSIIVIEDIDCSLQLSGSRTTKRNSPGDEEAEAEDDEKKEQKKENEEGKKKKKEIGESKLTLSGLLNFIDGLWSACGGERLIVFTTNHVEKLDPALIRRGRMDVHIELGYCDFEAFKVLVKNYLDVEEHPMFAKVKELLEMVKISPADVAEQLMPKNIRAKDKASRCLDDLLQALQKLKEEKLRDEKTKNEQEEKEVED
ncbi:AAA-ATPase [Canna indica]|uniref:AAA-ATPase n=1 Tax=Canna indica TaxID=4628 RepID=A0AAQ3KQQ3_9LILI|nr:AAA-ATPase [Canna indica]